MAQCPGCKAEYLSGDRFCMFCGASLEETAQDGGISLTGNDLAALAGSFDYSPLSPLAPHYVGPAKASPVTLDASAKRAILSPKRAFYFLELARDTFSQDVLLVGEGTYHRWSEGESGVTITKENSPRDFIAWTQEKLTGLITTAGELPLTSIRKRSLRSLTAVAILCGQLTGVDPAASFVTLSDLEFFLDGKEELSPEIEHLVRNGFLRTVGDDDPLIFLEEKGEKLHLLLNEYDRYFVIQVLTNSVPDYPCLALAARKGSLCLITSPEGSPDIFFRGMDRDGTSSLINWAWTTGV